MRGDQGRPDGTGKPDGTGEIGSEPERARRSARKLLKELDGPVDEDFKQSLEGLSRHLGERAAGRSDSRATAEARKAALHAYDAERTHKLKTILKAVGGVALTVSITGAVVLIASPFDRPQPRASTAPAKPAQVAAVEQIQEPARSLLPATPPLAAKAVLDPWAVLDPQSSLDLAPAKTTLEPEKALPPPIGDAEEPPLQRDEVRDIQARLRAFGFNPGPLDGIAGPATQAAMMHYQQNRELPQTGTIDRQLLEQLRQDPAPEVVAPQVVQRTARPARASGAARSSDPFDPLRTAAQDFERWLQSLGR